MLQECQLRSLPNCRAAQGVKKAASGNRWRVLEGCQYLVRYLTMTREEFVNVPYRSGLLCKDEEEALLAQISCRGTAKATAAAVDLPEHLWQWQTIMRTKRRGKAPAHGIQISSGRKFTYSGLGKAPAHGIQISSGRKF